MLHVYFCFLLICPHLSCCRVPTLVYNSPVPSTPLLWWFLYPLPISWTNNRFLVQLSLSPQFMILCHYLTPLSTLPLHHYVNSLLMLLLMLLHNLPSPSPGSSYSHLHIPLELLLLINRLKTTLHFTLHAWSLFCHHFKYLPISVANAFKFYLCIILLLHVPSSAPVATSAIYPH